MILTYALVWYPRFSVGGVHNSTVISSIYGIPSLTTSNEQGSRKTRRQDGDDASWDASPAQTMCDETRNFQIPIDIDGRKMTMGDLYDLTPKEFISKVGLEEKVFETWHHGRTVLLGDGMEACARVVGYVASLSLLWLISYTFFSFVDRVP